MKVCHLCGNRKRHVIEFGYTDVPKVINVTFNPTAYRCNEVLCFLFV